jgi:hypothetical protein
MFRSKLKFKPLPMNIPEWEAWRDRIIDAAQLPTKNRETQEFALAGMILQTPPHEFMRPDEYYINLLRKAASDQVALQVMEDLKAARSKRVADEKAN